MFTSAVAQSPTAQSDIGFEIDGQTYEMTLPQGYCLPEAELRNLSLYIASLDTMNDTMVDIQRCGTFGEDYTHIKIQKQRTPIDMPRPQFIALLSEHMQSEMGQQALDRGSASAEQRVGNETKGGIMMKGTGSGYGGSDSECAYVVGSAMVDSDEQPREILFASCITLIGGYSLSINSYGMESEGATIENLKQRSREIAGLIEAQ